MCIVSLKKITGLSEILVLSLMYKEKVKKLIFKKELEICMYITNLMEKRKILQLQGPPIARSVHSNLVHYENVT